MKNKRDSFGITGFFVCVVACLLALTLLFNAPAQAKPAPVAPRYEAMRVFVEYHELGAYDVYVVTAAGERLELNALCARDGLTLVAMTEDAQGYKVGVFSR